MRGVADWARKVGVLERRTRRLLYGDDYERDDGLCRAAPEWLVLGINNFCNLHCKMCDVGLGDEATVFYRNLIGDDPRNMSRDLLELVLDQARLFRPLPRIGFAFTEPLLHKEIVVFCEAAAKRGFFSSVTTNGYLLPRLAEGLVESGLTEITVSVDGPRSVHDGIRRSGDSFDRLYSGVERLNAARRRAKRSTPRVQFSYTITDENYTDMVDFAREIEPLAPHALSFSHLNFITSEMAEAHNATVEDGELHVTRSNLGDMALERIDIGAMWSALEALKAYARDGSGARFTLVPDFQHPDECVTFYRDPSTFVGGRACTDPWRMMMVQTDGTVIPAHGRCYHVPLGRLPGQTLQEIWNGARFASVRRTLKGRGGTLPACSRCCGVIGKG